MMNNDELNSLQELVVDNLIMAKAIYDNHWNREHYPDSLYSESYSCIFCECDSVDLKSIEDIKKPFLLLKHDDNCPVRIAIKVLKKEIQEA